MPTKGIYIKQKYLLFLGSLHRGNVYCSLKLLKFYLKCKENFYKTHDSLRNFPKEISIFYGITKMNVEQINLAVVTKYTFILKTFQDLPCARTILVTVHMEPAWLNLIWALHNVCVRIITLSPIVSLVSNNTHSVDLSLWLLV